MFMTSRARNSSDSPHASSKARQSNAPSGRSRNWLIWLIGIAFLVGVGIVATHFSEEAHIFRLALKAKLGWLAAAMVLQAGTYIAQGEIWWSIGRMAGVPLQRSLVYKLALAKLFVDQSLPSGGASGTVVV